MTLIPPPSRIDLPKLDPIPPIPGHPAHGYLTPRPSAFAGFGKFAAIGAIAAGLITWQAIAPRQAGPGAITGNYARDATYPSMVQSAEIVPRQKEIEVYRTSRAVTVDEFSKWKSTCGLASLFGGFAQDPALNRLGQQVHAGCDLAAQQLYVDRLATIDAEIARLEGEIKKLGGT